MSNKCPFCDGDCVYYDGTSWNPGHLHAGWNRSRKCYEGEVLQLRTRIKELEAVAEAAVEHVRACELERDHRALGYIPAGLIYPYLLEDELERAGYLKD